MPCNINQNPLTVLPFNHLNDCSFNIALYEMAHGPLHFDGDCLDTLLFNPIDESDIDHLTQNLDQNSNFATLSPTSSYMVQDEVNTILKSKQENASFSLLHVNACSLLSSFDDLKSFVENSCQSSTAIGISETWLNDTTSDRVNLPGYNFLSCHRTARSGGGVGLYLRNDLEYRICSECNFSDPNMIESLFVEIFVPNSKNIVVGIVYRSPNQNLSLFLDKFNEILSTISKNNKHCYIMGDYNIDMYCLNEHSATNEFIENLFSDMFLPLISMPTRITAHSATLIDNIFTNHLTQNLFSGIIINDLSDHLPVFVYVFTETPPPCKSAEKIILRDLGNSNITKFRSHLTNVNWENLSNQDIDDAFQCEFSRLYDLSFPPKSVRTKNSNKPLTPWMTRGLLTCVRKKNKLCKKFIISRSPDKERQYKIYKNKLTNLKKTYLLQNLLNKHIMRTNLRTKKRSQNNLESNKRSN